MLFSVVIPTKNRPHLLGDAIASALAQDMSDYEIIVSDNFNDETTREVVDRFAGESHLRYVRTDREMNMPDHWEFATLHAQGDYVLVLTDRMLMRPGALAFIRREIEKQRDRVEICSWGFNNFREDSKTLACGPFGGPVERIPSAVLLENFGRYDWGKARRLPRGLDSCYSRGLAETVRARAGRLFQPTSPDYISAFLLLLSTDSVLYIDRPLYLSRALDLSNGMVSMRTGGAAYLTTLGDCDPWRFVPIKSLLSRNMLTRDYLVACHQLGRPAAWDRAGYYVTCLEEMAMHKEVDGWDIGPFLEEWRRALEEESPEIVKSVRARTGRMERGLTSGKTWWASWVSRCQATLRQVPTSPRRVYWFLRHSNVGCARRYSTALEAARKNGF